MRLKYPKYFGLGAVLALAAVTGCATVGTNTTGTPTNPAEQVAGGGYGAYIAADSAWLAYLTAGKPSVALVRSVEPKRKAARAALDSFSAASVKGNAAAEQTAFGIALKAYTDSMTAGGVSVPATALQGS